MPMYNFIDYVKKYRNPTDIMHYYCRHEPVNLLTDSESFMLEKCMTEKALNNDGTEEVKFVVLLKYLSNF